MKPYILQLLSLIFCASLYAQKDTDVLLHINEEPILVGEFKKVYLKNIELLQDDTKKDPAGYLELFIPYKLKVQEAYKLGLDKKQTYQDELAGYKKQLAKTFLTDVALTDRLVEEAYDRLINEVNARHILIKVAANASPADTLTAYNKAIEARSKVMNGEDFNKIAKAYSDDPSAKINGGELGWFKAFKMVYPFEKAAYSTPVNEISMPFKTSFGYHIVQTTAKRKAEGAVQVAHIMILQKQKDSTVNPQERIQQIYELLQQGEDFGSLAKTYSDDKKTGENGGVLRQFERGQITSAKFEDAAFRLQKIGDYSEPFETKFGWHISKLIARFPIQSFEEQKNELEIKIKKDKRSQVLSEALITRLRKEYNTKDISAIIDLMKDAAIGSLEKDKWVYKATAQNSKKQAFSLKDSTYGVEGLAKFLERTYNPNRFSNKEHFLSETTRRYVDLKTQAYHEEHLEELDADFANVLREYREGLLIFDLMDQKIWSEARTDSLGLVRFYESNTQNYKEPQKAIATVFTAQDKTALVEFKSLLQSNAQEAIERLPTFILKTAKELVLKETSSFAKGYTPKTGISEVYAHNEGYVFYKVSEILPERIQKIDEAKGALISDYQQYLETNWIEKLKSNAVIVVEKKILKKLTKQLEKID